MGDGVLNRRFLVLVRAAIGGVYAARFGLDRQIDHFGPSRHGVVNACRFVHAVAIAGVVEHFDIDDLRVPAQSGNTYAVVGGCGDDAGDERAMAIFVIGRGTQRPVVGERQAR